MKTWGNNHCNCLHWHYTHNVEYQSKDRRVSNIFTTALLLGMFPHRRKCASNAKISEEQWIQRSFCLHPLPHPPISVSIDSYISVLDLLRRFILQIAFSFGQPQLTNQNAGSAQREAGNLRKQTSAVNQKWFQRMITDGATEECSYKFCVSPVIHTFPKLLSTLLQNSL